MHVQRVFIIGWSPCCVYASFTGPPPSTLLVIIATFFIFHSYSYLAWRVTLIDSGTCEWLGQMREC